MPVKHFGIFLAYSPNADLRKEGLGRLLAAFLKAAGSRTDVRFVIACPLWFAPNLRAFCESESISPAAFEIVTTDGVPFILRVYFWYQKRKEARPEKSLLARIRDRIRDAVLRHRRYIELQIVAARSVVPWLVLSLYGVILAIVLSPFAVLLWLCLAIRRGFLWVWRKLFGAAVSVSLKLIYPAPGEEGLELRLYRLMEDVETKRLRKKINSLTHVNAWFSPTAFWPEFNQIAAPGLLCVPDVLLAEFPIGFAREPELLKSFANVERTIRGGRSFVTYSSRVKWDTLVDRYGANPNDVAVIPHACSDLSPWIMIKGFSDNVRATTAYCELLLQQALGRLGKTVHIQGLSAGSMRFLFYASQFRPNKNIILLLQAYNYLLRERFIHHKLILTGDPNRDPRVVDFIEGYGLSKDVVFLHGLSISELAACYYLADLAVNPSLSEGGCPFTFTEALSVNTPVVMARISVTEETLPDPDLQQMMLFDPYDYKDAASRIEWGIKNRTTLLHAQTEAYNLLRQRTWRDVVDEYVVILDGLGNGK